LEVDDDEVGAARRGERAVGRLGHGKPGFFEHAPRDEPCRGVTVDDMGQDH
jgi:hypothetical protein